MLQIKDINCCLCLVKSEEMLDVFGAEGLQLRMASTLSLHYGFVQVCFDATIVSPYILLR